MAEWPSQSHIVTLDLARFSYTGIKCVQSLAKESFTKLASWSALIFARDNLSASSCSTNSKSERRKENFDLNVEPPEKLHLSSLNARSLQVLRMMMDTHSE